METRGIYLPGNKEAHVKEWTVSEPRGDEVLIQVKAAALCASDMSIYKGNPLIPGYPSGTFIVGHEPCGIVAGTGPDVRRVREGDRVAIIAFTSCGDCDYCRTGEPMLCAEMGVIGFTAHGGDADYLVVPERMCLPLPDTVKRRGRRHFHRRAGQPLLHDERAGAGRGRSSWQSPAAARWAWRAGTMAWSPRSANRATSRSRSTPASS